MRIPHYPRPRLRKTVSTRGKHAWVYEVQSYFFILLWYKRGKRENTEFVSFHPTWWTPKLIFPPSLYIYAHQIVTAMTCYLLLKDIRGILYNKLEAYDIFRVWETSIRPSGSFRQSIDSWKPCLQQQIKPLHSQESILHTDYAFLSQTRFFFKRKELLHKSIHTDATKTETFILYHW